MPLTDICDELAGNYPKGFKFTGWHPNCRCHTETILLNGADFEDFIKAIILTPEGDDMNKLLRDADF